MTTGFVFKWRAKHYLNQLSLKELEVLKIVLNETIEERKREETKILHSKK